MRPHYDASDFEPALSVMGGRLGPIARALGGLVQQVRATTPNHPEETVIAAASRSLGVDRASVQSGLRLGSAVPRLPSVVQCWPPEALSGSRAGLGEVGRSCSRAEVR